MFEVELGLSTFFFAFGIGFDRWLWPKILWPKLKELFLRFLQKEKPKSKGGRPKGTKNKPKKMVIT